MASAALAEAPDPEPAERKRLQAALALCGAPLLALKDKVGVRAWLGSTAASKEQTDELVERLANHIDKPEFLEHLTASCSAQHGGQAAEACTEDVTREDFWKWDEATGTFKEGEQEAEGTAAAQPTPPPPAQDAQLGSSYVMVEHEHVVEAVAMFIAQFVASHPEAMNMPPKKLQKAVSHALRDIKKSRVRKVLSAGRTLHRWAVWSYGAFRLYDNPWIARAVGMAFWASLRLMLGMVF